MTAPRTPTDVLKDARRRDSHQKRARVFAAVDEIKHTDTPITFALIARAAQVSTWLVYADGECGHLTWPHFGRCSSRILAPSGW